MEYLVSMIFPDGGPSTNWTQVNSASAEEAAEYYVSPRPNSIATQQLREGGIVLVGRAQGYATISCHDIRAFVVSPAGCQSLRIRPLRLKS